MIVREYESARAFLDYYETVLLERETISQLILYNAYQCNSNFISEKGMFGAVLDEEKTLLLYCNIVPNSLVIYTVSEDSVATATTELARFLGSKYSLISGINARNDVCQSFIEQYKEHFNCSFVEKLGTDIMEIRQVNDIKTAEGIQRLALPEESKLVADLMIEFQIEAFTSEMDYEAALLKAIQLIENNKIYLFETKEGKVVSMAAKVRELAHGVAISYVFTPEEYRGMGYAAANIYYLSKQLLEQGYDYCTLFVDKKNPLSNRAYEKVGYKILEDNFEYSVIQNEAKEVGIG